MKNLNHRRRRIYRKPFDSLAKRMVRNTAQRIKNTIVLHDSDEVGKIFRYKKT